MMSDNTSLMIQCEHNRLMILIESATKIVLHSENCPTNIVGAAAEFLKREMTDPMVISKKST